MKLNKKIIIPAITLMVGTTLAGSVASTVAWYQYSTRTNVSYIGTSAGTIGNLQIRLAGGEWGTRLSIQDVANYLLSQGVGQQVEPITAGPLAKDAKLKKSVWRQVTDIQNGVADPEGDLGHAYYLNTANNKFYAYSNAAWNEVTVARVAEAEPEIGIFNPGDFYVNSEEGKVYEKVFSSQWEEFSDDIATGTETPEGDKGHAYYLNTNNNKLYYHVADDDGNDANDAWNLLGDVAVVDAAPDIDGFNFDDLYINSAEGYKIYRKAYVDGVFYSNPIAGLGSYSKWLKASSAKYVKLPLQLRYMAQDEAHLSAEDVYLSKLVIREDMHNDDVEDHGDISDAVRIHFSAYEEGDEENAVNHLVSKNGGTTLTHGKLKLEGGNDFDKAYADNDEFGFNGSSFDYVNYGGTEGTQNSYSATINGNADAVFYDEEVPASGWKEIGTIGSSGSGAPAAVSGNNGDFYRDVDTNTIYLKNNDAWGSFLVGSEFNSGEANPTLATSNSKLFYLNTNSNKIFECGYHNETVDPILVSTANDSLVLDDLDNSKIIGETVATQSDPQHYLNVDVTIWIEGWHKFYNHEDVFSSLWDRDLVGAIFDVGFQFAVQDR